MEPVIRKVTSRDIPAIMEICRNIWEGYDYLPRVLEKWIADPHGEFIAAEVSGQIGAVGKLTIFRDGSGWLEGLRGNPQLKGQGLAKLLTQHLVQRSIELRLPALRLATYFDNQESLHIITRIGFREIRRFINFEREAAQEGYPETVPERPPARNVTPDETGAVWDIVHQSRFMEQCGGYVARAWDFWQLDRDDLKDWAERGELWALPGYHAVGTLSPDPHYPTCLQLNILHAGMDVLPELVNLGLAEAARQGLEALEYSCPDVPELIEALFALGFRHFGQDPPAVGHTILLEFPILGGS